MAKVLPVNQSRTVNMSVDQLLSTVAANIETIVGVEQRDPNGSATITKLEQNGNSFTFEANFSGGVRKMGKLWTGAGTSSGTVTLTALGANTTRLDCRGTVAIDENTTAAKAPNWLLNKFISEAIDEAVTHMITDLGGPHSPSGPGLAA